jgi:hypothetical protein
MIRKSSTLIIFTLAVLLGLLASPAAAERLSQRVARGNNVGLGLVATWCAPMITASWTGNTIQFPKGSGNFLNNDAWTFGLTTARDLDGDGLVEDTIVMGSGGRDNMTGYASIEGYDVITAAGLVEPNMEGYMAEIQFNRIWTTADAGELADWPIEAREPRTASGTPVTHGAETMFIHTGDVYNSWSGPTQGFYMGWSFYFMDFAESNNMVYSHVYMENVSEYEKYNPTYKTSTMYSTTGAEVPPPANGWPWAGMILFQNCRQFAYNGNPLGWGYHPAKEIYLHWSRTPSISSFTPSFPPLLGVKMLKAPSLRGQTAPFTGIFSTTDGEFGISGPSNLLASGLPHPKVYRVMLNIEKLFGNVINPLTNRVMTQWPGVILPTDSRYNQWVWGGAGAWQDYAFWGELNNVAPRDTMSFDWVMMWTPTGVTPLVAPTYDIANIDAPVMQEGFAPMARYADVAQTVYEGGYILPATPASPPLSIIPGDRQVTLTWSDVNLQTPDPYYFFLQANPELDPNKVYREFDFEGYRVYRNYVAPNNEHSEKIYDCSLSAGNLTFFFIDKLQTDQPYFRMRNGEKVWYALVPYDRNYDPSTGGMFSLPDPASGKTWNRAGESGLYNVIPRSDASNFKPAALNSVSFTPIVSGTYVDAASATLTGDGTGKLTEAPKLLAPVIKTLTVIPVNSERVTADKTVYLVCTQNYWYDQGCAGNRQLGTRVMAMQDGSYETATADLTGGGSDEQKNTFQGQADANGINYAVDVTFAGLANATNYRAFYYDLNAGSYTGGVVDLPSARYCSGNRIGTSPSNIAVCKSGQFTITWKDAGSGNLTVEVKDVVRGLTLEHVDYPDQYGWGFQTLSGFGAEIGASGERGVYYNEAFADLIPFNERTVQMATNLPASNTEMFGLWVNGCLWRVSVDGSNGITMPAAGTVWTATNAFGSWNSDQTVFTQTPDMPWAGDKWTIEIKASTMKASDADLSKVKVVPNPYIASSFLDQSPTQRRIEFINLPDRCTIRIFTLGGNLVNVLNHIGSNRSGWGNYTDWDRLTLSQPKVMTGFDNHSGTEPWNLRNRFGQTVASGLYFYHVTDTQGKTVTGKFYVID